MKEIQELYEKYHNMLMLYALTLSKDYHVAEDLVQDTFYKAIKSIHKFEGKSKVSGWLCQILKNTFYDYCKKNTRVNFIKDYKDLEDMTNTLEEEVFLKETEREFIRAFLVLEDPYKEVFMMRQFQEMSFSEIAIQFKKSESWAKVTFYRAKEKIKKIMSE